MVAADSAPAPCNEPFKASIKSNDDDAAIPGGQPSWPHRIAIGGGIAAAHALPLADSGHSELEVSGAIISYQDGGRKVENTNLVLLGTYFCVYFAFRSGCLIVLPLYCKKLLKSELDDAEYSPLYQLPLAVWFIMDILYATPNAFFMRKYGRSAGFTFGACGALVASVSMFFALRHLRDTPWVCFAALNCCVAVMASIGMGEFIRYAAAEACLDENRRGQAVTRVLTGGALASFGGPLSATISTSLAPEPGGGDCVLCSYPFFFLIMAGFASLAVMAAALLRLPKPNYPPPTEHVPLFKIIRRPAVSLAIFSQVVIQVIMVAPMSGFPLALSRTMGDTIKKDDVSISAVIVAHVVAMFLPGVVTGNVIQRVGIWPVMAFGLVLEGAANIVLILNQSLAAFVVGLILLGVGFNAAFTSGTMLLIRSHTLEERARVTSANETLRFTANACAVLLSSTIEWKTLNYCCLGAVVTMFPVMCMSRSAASTPPCEQ